MSFDVDTAVGVSLSDLEGCGGDMMVIWRWSMAKRRMICLLPGVPINYKSRKNLVVGPGGALSQLCVITLTDGGPISAVFGPLCLACAPPTVHQKLHLSSIDRDLIVIASVGSSRRPTIRR